MDQVVQACTIKHNMVEDCRDADSTIGTKSFVSNDLNAEVTPIATNFLPLNDYDAPDYIEEPADSITDKKDHALLQDGIADAI